MRCKRILVLFLTAVLLMMTACQKVTTEKPAEQTTETFVDSKQETPQPVEETVQPEGETDPELSLVALEVLGASDGAAALLGVDVDEFWSYERQAGFQDANAPKTLTIIVNGESLTGSYEKSQVSVPDLFQRDRYKFDGGRFSVIAGTEKLDDFMSYKVETAGNLSMEECHKMAEQFVRETVKVDLELYVLTVEEYTYFYNFAYVRCIDGFETGEIFSIQVNKSGRVQGFGSRQLGAFADFTDSSQRTLTRQKLELLSSAEAKKSLVALIDRKCGDIKERYDNPEAYYTYEINWGHLIALPEGDLGMLYQVSLDVNLPEERDGKTYINSQGSLIEILVKCA